MKLMNKIKNLYFNTKPERILSLVNYSTIKNKLEDYALNKTELGIDENNDIIISLTTYSNFINQVHITIESLMEQTVKPKKIVLWISDKYKDYEIPEILNKQKKRGLEIRKTRDIGSYKKLIPALQEFPNNPIITCDDDVIYPIDTIEWLLKAYKNDPAKIYFRRGHKMILKDSKHFIPYNNFIWEMQDLTTDIYNFFTGVGGVLYPPNCFDSEVFNYEKFSKLAPYADDIWFNAMALKNNTSCQKIYTKRNCYIDYDLLKEDSGQRLQAKNVKRNKNDIQLQAVWDEYNLWEKYN